MTTNLIVLAAGMSSRMKREHNLEALTKSERDQANNRTKGLISLDASGRPLLDYILYNAKSAGITNVYIVTGIENQLFKQHYGAETRNNVYNGMNISYAIQHIPNDRNKPFGTADAVSQTLEQYPNLKSETFLVCNSDNLYSATAFRVLAQCSVPNALVAYSITGLKFDKERLQKFAILEQNKQGYLTKIVEKPSNSEYSFTTNEKTDIRVSMNIFKFDGALFYDYLRDCPIHKLRKEKELPTALGLMINEMPNSVKCIGHTEHVPDLTSKADIPILKKFIKQLHLSNWS